MILVSSHCRIYMAAIEQFITNDWLPNLFGDYVGVFGWVKDEKKVVIDEVFGLEEEQLWCGNSKGQLIFKL